MAKLKEQLASSQEVFRQKEESLLLNSKDTNDKYRLLEEKEICLAKRERELESCADTLATQEERVVEMQSETRAQQAKVRLPSTN